MYLGFHDLIVETLPGVVVSVDTVDASIGYGAKRFGCNGWGLAAVTPYSTWVSLTLLRGADLADPEGLLVGASKMRHVKLSSVEQLALHRDAIRTLVRAAATLHEQ